MPKAIRKRRRDRLIGFKAFEDTDQDVIDWWEGMEPGHRSRRLRELIRQDINSNTEDEDVQLKILKAIDTLRQNMSAQFRSLGQQVDLAGLRPPPTDEVDGESLTDEQANTKKQSILNNKW